MRRRRLAEAELAWSVESKSMSLRALMEVVVLKSHRSASLPPSGLVRMVLKVISVVCMLTI